MTTENILVLAILAGALILFISEKLRPDVVALLVLVVLAITGILTVEQALSGFSSPAVVTVWSVFIISGALYHTGVADAMARAVLALAGNDPLRLTVLVMVTVGVLSAFMNNIGAVAIMLPAVITVAKRANIPASKLLIPLAFASLMGGNMTLVGTPPNILAAGILGAYPGLEPFSFFDFLPMGIVVLTIGVVYMALVGRHLLPVRVSESAPEQARVLRPYLSEVKVSSSSSLIGKSLPETDLGKRYNLNVIHIRRGDQAPFFPAADQPLQRGDLLLVEGQRDDLLNAGNALQLRMVSPAQGQAVELELTPGSAELAEIALAPRSDLAGKSLRDISFRGRYDLSVLALRHLGHSILTKMHDVPLEFGDSLLVQGEKTQIDLLHSDDNFLVLDTPPIEARRLGKAPLALVILIGVLIVIALGVVHPSIAMLSGALLLVITRVLTMQEAYQSIDWKSVFLIAGILPLGLAMEITGTAQLIADVIVNIMGDYGAQGVLIGFFIMTSLLTAIISNAAATVLVVPIAIESALTLDASPYAFVMAVVIAASTSFLLPIGHQANIIVFGPGGYRFFDYTKVGIWLNILLLLAVALILPIFWPLYLP